MTKKEFARLARTVVIRSQVAEPELTRIFVTEPDPKARAAQKARDRRARKARVAAVAPVAVAPVTEAERTSFLAALGLEAVPLVVPVVAPLTRTRCACGNAVAAGQTLCVECEAVKADLLAGVPDLDEVVAPPVPVYVVPADVAAGATTKAGRRAPWSVHPADFYQPAAKIGHNAAKYLRQTGPGTKDIQIEWMVAHARAAWRNVLTEQAEQAPA